MRQGRKIHFLPPYRSENALWLEKLLGIRAAIVKDYASAEFVKAVIAQRSLKSPEEIKEIEAALTVSAAMYREAMAMAQPGIYEREIAGLIEGIALAGGGQLAFPAIVTRHGETLHNHFHGNCLRQGRPAGHRCRRRDRERLRQRYHPHHPRGRPLRSPAERNL